MEHQVPQPEVTMDQARRNDIRRAMLPEPLEQLIQAFAAGQAQCVMLA